MPQAPADDVWVERLARLFREHPAWIDAARRMHGNASSAVYFQHRPGEVWRLVRRDGVSVLEPGAAPDPDLVFRFSPASIERLEAVEGGVGDFAVALFDAILEEDETRGVGFRVVAPLWRLARRGYVRLLLEAGPRVLAFGARHGVRTLGQLRRLVDELRRRGPAPWESP